MKFEVGDYVTPRHDGLIGYGSIFKIQAYDNLCRRYKIEFISGGISFSLKEICEASDWYEDDLTKVEFSTVDTAINFNTANKLTGVRVSADLPLINLEEGKITSPKLGIEINENGVFGNGWSITKNEKENNDMNKILEIYKERQLKKYEDYYNKELIKIKSEDEIQKIVEEMESQIKTIFENEDREFKTEIYLNEYTEKTLKDLEDLGIARKLFEKSIDLTIEEVEALLNMTDNFEEKQKILKAYNILDKKGTLNV